MDTHVDVIHQEIYVPTHSDVFVSAVLQEYAQARFDAYFQQKKIWAV